MLRRYKKFFLILAYILSLIIVGLVVWYIADSDPNRGQIRGVVDNFNPLETSEETDISKQEEITPEHAFAIANLIFEEFLENNESFSDYLVTEVKDREYFRVQKFNPEEVGGEVPEIIIDKKTGAILQFGIE